MVLRVKIEQDNSIPNPLEEENSWVKFWVKEAPSNYVDWGIPQIPGFGEKPANDSKFQCLFLKRDGEGVMELSDENVGQGFAYSEMPIDPDNLDTFQEIAAQAVVAYNQWIKGDVWAVTIDTENGTDTSYENFGSNFDIMALDFNWTSYGINFMLGSNLIQLAHENEGEILAFTEGESYPALLTGSTKVFRLVEGNWEAYN
jgi:hypothetical protein